MKAVGIIAECNPFHEGHAHIIAKARELTGADYVIAALSGDYVQRGAPAILPWETRVRSVLEGGADLVVALPLYTSCAGADYFARGGISLLSRMGVVTDLCFGSESGDLDALQKEAAFLYDASISGSLAGDRAGGRAGDLAGGHAGGRTGGRAGGRAGDRAGDRAGGRAGGRTGDRAYDEALKTALREGLSYPAAREEAIARTAGGAVFASRSSNDILAVEYLKALRIYDSPLTPHAVSMIDCPSASQIREQLLSKSDGDPHYRSRNDLSQALLRALVIGGAPLSSYCDVSGDLADRILRLLPRYKDYSSFCALLKNRSLTYTRISRALLHILLGMTDASMEVLQKENLCGWIRPLGFRRAAAPLLTQIQAHASVPFLLRPARAMQDLSPALRALLKQEYDAEFLYDLTAGGAQDTPVRYGPAKPLVYL
ncbi:MAG: nucleotidyltransferase family protein [Lachnospiraceae bacterium]|nr:nucleotidyltransferase family protein [Lachnospiraceae bacterium]